jgi:hypothetical protein
VKLLSDRVDMVLKFDEAVEHRLDQHAVSRTFVFYCVA